MSSQLIQKFYNENYKAIEKKINTINLSFKIDFVKKSIPKKIYEINQELIFKVKNNNKEIIEKNKSEELNIEKSYRRKIKKKIIEN